MGKKILIVDDEKKIIEVVKAYLEKNGYETIIAQDGDEAIKFFMKEKIDLIILDIMMPNLNGHDVCMKIRGVSDVPIIFLSAKVKEKDRIYGIGIGADDYISKPFSVRELVSRVQAVLRRCDNNSLPMAEYYSFNGGELKVDFKKFEVYSYHERLMLTPNEFKILRIFIINKNQVLSRKQILDRAFGLEFEGYDRTIDVHIRNLRSKIEKNSKEPKYIQTIYGVGYKFVGDKS